MNYFFFFSNVSARLKLVFIAKMKSFQIDKSKFISNIINYVSNCLISPLSNYFISGSTEPRSMLIKILLSKFLVHLKSNSGTNEFWHEFHHSILQSMAPISRRTRGLAHGEDGEFGVRLDVGNEEALLLHHRRRVVIHFGLDIKWRHQLNLNIVLFQFFAERYMWKMLIRNYILIFVNVRHTLLSWLTHRVSNF